MGVKVKVSGSQWWLRIDSEFEEHIVKKGNKCAMHPADYIGIDVVFTINICNIGDD